VVNVGGVTPATSVAWGAITGTLSSQTDLQNALDLKLAATTAASTYQTLAGMSSYLTSSTAATTYATILEPSVDGILTVEPSGSNSATVNVNQDANNYIHLRAGAGQIAMVYGGATKWFFNDTYLQFPGGTQQTVAYPGPSGFLLKADNLSGLANTGTARTNLGLGTMATETATNYLTTATASSTYLTQSNAASTYQTISGMSSYLTTSAAASTYQTQAGMSSYLTTSSAASTYAPLASPTFTGTVTIPGGASISGYATTASLSSYAPLASPTFTGVPAAPTAAVDTNTTQVATTAYVVGQGYLKSATASSTYAPLASPALTGTPTAPTATAGTSTTQLATTAFVTTADNLKANLASPTFTGTPAAPTASAGTNTTQIATTAFVRADNNVKAWVNFNGSGTVSIRSSFNVSSITDNGTGDYTVNFTTAMADTNYVVNAASTPTVSTGQWRLAIAHGRGTTPYYEAPTTSACRVVWVQNVATVPDIDNFQCMVSILR
jgi:hypothetical protein